MFEELIVSFSADLHVLIEPNVLEVMYLHRQISATSCESGGVLVGNYRGKNIQLVGITEPQHGDIKGRYKFLRRSKHHGSEIKNRWENSGHTNCWMGDWHTHPESKPTPSPIDINSWKRNYYNRPMISVIVGTHLVWIGLHQGGRICSRSFENIPA